MRHDRRGALVGVLDRDLAQAFDPAVDAACLGWYGWATLQAAVDEETYRRARMWWRTFGYEQLGAAVLNGEPPEVLDHYATSTVAWLERTVEAGFPCWPIFKIDPHLECLHEAREFKRLVTDLERKYTAVKIRRL